MTVSGRGPARTAVGQSRNPSASACNARRAIGDRKRDDMFYSGTLTSRPKRYAAEPAPDGLTVTPTGKQTAKRTAKPARSAGAAPYPQWITTADDGELATRTCSTECLSA